MPCLIASFSATSSRAMSHTSMAPMSSKRIFVSSSALRPAMVLLRPFCPAGISRLPAAFMDRLPMAWSTGSGGFGLASTFFPALRLSNILAISAKTFAPPTSSSHFPGCCSRPASFAAASTSSMDSVSCSAIAVSAPFFSGTWTANACIRSRNFSNSGTLMSKSLQRSTTLSMSIGSTLFAATCNPRSASTSFSMRRRTLSTPFAFGQGSGIR
mmetsp:Transcript_66288/g.191348  ORF Transcript_66288/g.191348 Transcript_66288/m.191348 type:complete len:213 (+) Transcript_66288:420-1058(+)